MNDPYLVVDYEYDYTLNDYDIFLDDDVALIESRDYYDESDYVIDTSLRLDDDVTMDLNEFLDSEAWSVARLILYGVAIVLIVTSNILLLIVIRRVRYLKTSSNRYVVSVAVADIFMAMYCGVKVTASVAPSLLGNIYLCLSVQLGWVCLATVSQVLTLFLTFDSYFALWHPIRYNQVLTSWKANITILLAWLYSGTIAIVPLMWLIFIENQDCHIEDIIIHRYLIFFNVHFLVTLFIAVLVFIFVYYEIRTSKVVLKVYKKRRKQRQVYEERRKKDVQNAYCMTVIVTSYYCFWLPYYVVNSIIAFYGRSQALTLLEVVSKLAIIYHSCVNPMVYVCRLHTFQIACYRVLCCFLTNRFPTRPPSDNIQLRSLSFRNHVTGSMMSLHTTIGNDGKIVRIPQVIVADYDPTTTTTRYVTSEQYHYALPCATDEDDDDIDVWVTPRSPTTLAVSTHSSGGTAPSQEVYRKRYVMGEISPTNSLTTTTTSVLESDNHKPTSYQLY